MQNQKISIVFLSTILILGSSLTPAFAGAGIVVNSESDANVLADLLIGSGINRVGDATLIGANVDCLPAGTFTNGDSAGIGIDSGIVLTSGLATNVDQLNSGDGIGFDCGNPGDAMLDGLIPGFDTFDAAILEFDFQFEDGTVGGDLFFNYVFGSEEYNEYVDSDYNDVFAFFIEGQNIAIIPGSGGIPVAINNVNCEDPFNPPSGDFCNLFNNNDLSDGGPFFDFEYDGFTDVFTAQLSGLGPGTHTMQIKIADAGDGILDSGVFLEAGTFSNAPPTSALVAGEIIPIQTTALLIAGITSNLTLIGPIVVSAAIGVYLIRKR